LQNTAKQYQALKKTASAGRVLAEPDRSLHYFSGLGFLYSTAPGIAGTVSFIENLSESFCVSFRVTFVTHQKATVSPLLEF